MTKEGSLLTVGLKVTVTDRQHSFCLKLQKAPSGPHMHRIKWIREEFKKTCINEVNNHANLVSEQSFQPRPEFFLQLLIKNVRLRAVFFELKTLSISAKTNYSATLFQLVNEGPIQHSENFFMCARCHWESHNEPYLNCPDCEELRLESVHQAYIQKIQCFNFCFSSSY